MDNDENVKSRVMRGMNLVAGLPEGKTRSFGDRKPREKDGKEAVWLGQSTRGGSCMAEKRGLGGEGVGHQVLDMSRLR